MSRSVLGLACGFGLQTWRDLRLTSTASSAISNACVQINSLQDAINDAKAKAEDFNAREKVFGFPPTDYPILTAIEEDLQVREPGRGLMAAEAEEVVALVVVRGMSPSSGSSASAVTRERCYNRYPQPLTPS